MVTHRVLPPQSGFFFRFLKSHPEALQKYPALKNIGADDERLLQNPEFESLAQSYLQIFDDVVGDIEASPGNVDTSINKLIGVGKTHKRVPGMNVASFQVRFLERYVD